MATNTTTIKFVGQFDSSGITKGLQDIKKQITSSNISEELKKQLQTAFNKVEVNLPKLENFMKKEDFNLKELNQYQKLVQEITKDMTNFSKIANEADFTKNFSEQDTARLKKFDEQIKQIDDKLKNTKKEIIKAFSGTDQGKIGGKSNSSLNGVIEQLLDVPEDQIENKLNEIIKEAENQTENARDKLQEVFQKSSRGKNLKPQGIIDLLFGKDSGVTMGEAAKGKLTGDGGVYEQFDKIRQEILAFTKDTPVKEVEETLKSLSGFIDKYFNVPEGKESVLGTLLPKEVIDRIKTLANDIPGLKAILGKDKLELIANGEAEKLRATQEQAAELKKVIEGLAEKGQITRTEADKLVNSFTGLSGVIEDNANAAKNLENQQKTLNATFGGLASRIEHAVSAMAIFNKSMQIVRKAIKSVEDLDAAFTQIAIVSEQSNEAAWEMFDSFNSLARQYSITTKDLTEGAKLFYQQGLNAADTMKMVEASTISAALGEVTMTEAANTLTAAIQGYNESASVAMDYTDKIAMVGAVSAADFNELSAAMEKTASSAYTAGIDFDHLLGYLGKMIEVTREAPANLGTAMKTIIARFEDMKKDPDALIDGASANKVEAALATIGIALRDAAGEFRPLQDVFDELGMKWETLTRNQQAYIATVAAGSRQQSRFLAMMNNYDRTLDLIAESQNSAGAAAEQYAIYQDSVAAAQARLTASWEKFYSKIVDNGAIKLAINGLSSLVEALSHVPPAITAIGASLGALSIQHVLQQNGGVVKIISNLLGNNANKSVAEAGIDLAKKFVKNFKDKSIEEIANSSNIWKGLTNSTKEINESLSKTPSNIEKIGVGFKTVGKTILGFISGNWKLILVLGAVAAVVGTVTWALNKNKRAYEDSINTIKNYQKESTELNNKINNVETLFDSYDKLISIVNRTEEEQKELNSVIKQISDIYPEAAKWVDQYGNEHLENVNVLKEELEIEKDLAKQKQRAALEERQTLLSGDRKNWKKEDFTDINFSNAQVDAYFDLQNTLNYYNKLLQDRFINGLKHNSFKQEGTDNLVTKISSLQFAIDNNEIDKLEGVKYAIEEINEFIDKYELKMEKLDEDSGWENVERTLNKIKDLHSNLDSYVENTKNQQEEIIERLKRENTMKLSILDLVYDPKAGTASAQRAISAKLQTFISKLSNDAYKTLEKKFPEGKLSNFIQKIINKVTIENADDVANMLEKLFDPTTSSKDLEATFISLGDMLGEDFGDSFVQGFKDAIEKQKEVTRQEALNWYNKVFPKGGNTRNKTTEEITELARVGQEYGIDDSYLAETLLPTIQEVEKIYKDSLENKTTEGIEEGIHNVINNANLFGEAKGVMERIGELIVTKTISDVVINLISEALESTTKLVNESKENFSTATSIFDKDPEESITDKEYEFLQQQMENADSYIRINEEGEKYLTLLGKITLLEKEREDYAEALNEKIKVNEEYIKNFPKEGEDYTEEQKKQINNYKQQNRILEEQKSKLEDIKNTTINAKAISENISYADSYYEAIDAIKAAEDEAKKSNGRINRDTANTLMSINAEYSHYLETREDGEFSYYELTAENANKMRQIARKEYNEKLERARNEIDNKINVLNTELDYFQKVANTEGEINLEEYNAEVNKLNNLLVNNEEFQNERVNEEITANEQIVTSSATSAEQWANNWIKAAQEVSEAAVSAHKSIEDGSEYTGPNASSLKEKGSNMEYRTLPEGISSEDQRKEQIAQRQKEKLDAEIKQQEEALRKAEEEAQNISNSDAAKEDARKQVERIKASIEALRTARDQLKPLAPDLEDTSKSGGKADQALKKLKDTIKDLHDAIKDLDDLLKEVKKELKDIDVDYNPFTDLFEAWEHEWDYYYNIKRLLQQIDTQGQYIDNIISADYASAGQRIEAEQAKMGNILAKMAANDTYIEALRAGMSQTAVELMKDYGEYYKVDPTTGQLYQTDKNLNDINELMNERKEEIYNLQKLQNEKENDLALENAKLDALEQEKSAYEDILSTVESQLDKLKDNEDITADISGLENQKAELEAKIEVTDQSIEDAKDKIRDMEDEIQEIEVDITLKDQDFQKLEDYVSDMEDKVSEYEEYWENLNSTIAEQQELLQSLAEMRQGYIDTAISTQQALYDAIVENYQDEIDEKKKQYDYLKQLDNDYLKTIKDNISKERQAREDANKQREYQKNVQRAQLLQMDTSGAYRNELADLNKEIENQRQDLYDDLVDKQVEALEKEIEKRHELYDQEVQALEERLAYYQENAIILWEMVNSIVAEGANAMMATLQNTTEYMNSSELAKDEQRKAWEYDVQKTFEGIQNNVITTLDSLVEAGNKFIIEKYPEVGNSLTEYKKVFDDASKAVTDYNNQLISSRGTLNSDTEKATQVFQGVLDSFMTTWNDRTNEFTGYAKNWEDVTNALKEQTSKNLEELESLYDSQGRAIEGAIGSIEDYDESLRNASAEIYQDFLTERQNYRNELETLVSQIESDISDAISDAASAIRQAANSADTNPDNGGTGDDDESGGSGGKKYKLSIYGWDDDENNKTMVATKEVSASSMEEAQRKLFSWYADYVLDNWKFKYYGHSGIQAYAKGGLASFTGPAWLDGTQSSPERILSPKQTKLFESMVSSLERTANNSNINSTFGSSYNIGDINTTIQVEKLDNDTDINKVARQVEDRIMKSIRNRVTVSVK